MTLGGLCHWPRPNVRTSSLISISWQARKQQRPIQFFSYFGTQNRNLKGQLIGHYTRRGLEMNACFSFLRCRANETENRAFSWVKPLCLWFPVSGILDDQITSIAWHTYRSALKIGKIGSSKANSSHMKKQINCRRKYVIEWNKQVFNFEHFRDDAVTSARSELLSWGRTFRRKWRFKHLLPLPCILASRCTAF